MSKKVDELFALLLPEPEVVEVIVSDLDDVVDNVFEWEGEGELVTEAVRQGREDDDKKDVSEEVDDMRALTLPEPEIVEEAVFDIDEESVTVFERDGKDELVTETVA